MTAYIKLLLVVIASFSCISWVQRDNVLFCVAASDAASWYGALVADPPVQGLKYEPTFNTWPKGAVVDGYSGQSITTWEVEETNSVVGYKYIREAAPQFVLISTGLVWNDLLGRESLHPGETIEEIIDNHYTPHGNHQGLSVGWLVTLFLVYVCK